MNFIIK